MLDLRSALPVATTDDVDQALLLAAYRAGYNRGYGDGMTKGRALGSLVSGSQDASFQEGYDACHADLAKLGRLK